LGTLRIIAGELRGRRIRVPAGKTVRPTPDRVREALFSILGPELTGLAVLELFAGSGALGFEALSRGAARVTFVESDDDVRSVLSGNAADLGVEHRCRIVAGAVEALLRDRPVHLGGPYDLVLADPPYENPAGGGLLRGLETPALLVRSARIVLQRDRRAAPAETPTRSGGLARVRTALYGRNCLDFYAFSEQQSK
jgi:16S rRNA (guanine(966)-N(2))-methyltransferase RsmD